MADEHETRRSEAKTEEAIKGVAQEARTQSEALLSQASERSRGFLESQKEQTATHFESIAKALHRTADQLDSEGETLMGHYAGQTAATLDRMAGDLKRNDVSSVLGKVENYAREQPALFVGGALAAGILLSRFIRSSGSAAMEERYAETHGYHARAQAEYGELETRKPGSPRH